MQKLLLLTVVLSVSLLHGQEVELTAYPQFSATNTAVNLNHPSMIRPSEREAISNKNYLAAQIGFFDPWVGVYYERLFNANWGVDVALGLIGGSIGTKVYFPKLSSGHISFYTGISEGVLLTVGAKHYIPFGVTSISKNGFRISLDIGPQIYHDSSEEIQFGISLKMGKQ